MNAKISVPTCSSVRRFFGSPGSGLVRQLVPATENELGVRRELVVRVEKRATQKAIALEARNARHHVLPVWKKEWLGCHDEVFPFRLVFIVLTQDRRRIPRAELERKLIPGSVENLIDPSREDKTKIPHGHPFKAGHLSFRGDDKFRMMKHVACPVIDTVTRAKKHGFELARLLDEAKLSGLP